MIERTVAAGTHGRYLIEPPASPGPARILVGFHGYGEGAPAQLDRLRRIPGSDRWLLVSIQALHRFYQRRTNEVVASWMTREDRELAIADNLAYVAAVLDRVEREYPAAPRLVFAGFSQGVAMTFRAAAASPRPVDGVIAVGGDVPPDVDGAALARVRRTLLCRGSRDEWYTRRHLRARSRAAAARRPGRSAAGVRRRTRMVRCCRARRSDVSPRARAMIQIRAASTTDARALAELRWEFRSAQNAPAEAHDAFVKRCAMWMRRELQSSGAWKAWVALDNQVACRTGVAADDPEDPEPEPARRSGADRLPVQPVRHRRVSRRHRHQAARSGALLVPRRTDIDRVVLWPSRRSVTLYLSHGFSHGGEVMELKIRK